MEKNNCKGLAVSAARRYCFWGSSWYTPSSTCSSIPLRKGIIPPPRLISASGLYNYSYVLHDPYFSAGAEKYASY